MPSDFEAACGWLLDIQRHIGLAQGFVKGLDYQSFQGDDLRLYAVTRCLEIISEASRRLPAELKNRNPSIEWRDMAAAGNVYRHDYEDVAAQRIWHTLTVSLPKLKPIIDKELSMPPEQINWVTISIDLPDDIAEKLAVAAKDGGMSIECYCLRVILRHLLETGSPEQNERWKDSIPATLRRNGCDDQGDL